MKLVEVWECMPCLATKMMANDEACSGIHSLSKKWTAACPNRGTRGLLDIILDMENVEPSCSSAHATVLAFQLAMCWRLDTYL